MHTRTVLAIGLSVFAAMVLAVSVVLDEAGLAGSFGGLLGNLGTEVVGLVLTVAIIDWLIERKRIAEEVQRQAWQMLHDLDHAVWVWQGGRREFHLDELMALLNVAEPTDPMPAFTEELFINLGIRASDTLRLQPKLMNHDRRLRAALRSLAGLAQIREARSIVDSNYVLEGLKAAVSNLAELTGQSAHTGEFGVARELRDPTEDAQAKRYRGSMHDAMLRDDYPIGHPARQPAGQASPGHRPDAGI